MPCCDCKAICAFDMSELFNRTMNRKITQKQVYAELQAHGHPKSRSLENGKHRTTGEAIEELVEHYEFVHKLKRPMLETNSN